MPMVQLADCLQACRRRPAGESEAEDDLQCGVFVQDAQFNFTMTVNRKSLRFALGFAQAFLDCQF